MRRSRVPAMVRRVRIRPGPRYAAAKSVDWANKLDGVPAFILGNGCSVLKHDLSLLNNYFTIGINRIFKLFDPTILMWQDITFWNDEHSHLTSLKAAKFCRDVADPQRRFLHFRLRTGTGFKFEKQTFTLYGGGSSGPLACQLAYAMGCRPLILIGLDCDLGPEGQSDFYGKNPHWHNRTQKYCHGGLAVIATNCPVPVISCANANHFPYYPLEEAIKVVDPDSAFALGREHYLAKLGQKIETPS